MPPPRHSRGPAREVGAGFEPVQALLVDQIETEFAEADAGWIVAEPAANHRVHAAIGVTRPIAVAMRDAQVRHSQQDQAPQISVYVESRRREVHEDFHRGLPVSVAHERQVEQRFDRSTAKLYPQALVLCTDLLVRRTRRARDAGLT